MAGISRSRAAGKRALRAAAVLLLLGGAACSRESGSRDREGAREGAGPLSRIGRDNGSANRDARPSEGAPASDTRAGEAGAPPADSAPRAGTDGASDAPPNSSTDGRDRRVRIINNSGQVVRLVQGSAANQSAWGSDRIPTTTLAPGASLIVDFNDNNGECQYDLRATLADDTTREEHDANICSISDWVLTAGGSTVR